MLNESFEAEEFLLVELSMGKKRVKRFLPTSETVLHASAAP